MWFYPGDPEGIAPWLGKYNTTGVQGGIATWIGAQITMGVQGAEPPG